MSYVVTVVFEVAQARLPEFLPLMRRNARTSLDSEEGCLQFDVCVQDTTIFLYEVYETAAAFDVHLASEHFRSFDAAVSDMILTKDVKTFERVFP